MRVKFWGVRGSYPVAGHHTVRYGGNTSCVQLCPDDGTVIIIDGGTGIRRLGQELVRAPLANGDRRCHILIGHTHWDHIQGLPFFAPLYLPDIEVVYYAQQRDVHLGKLFRSQTADPYFPVGLDDVAADVTFRELVEASHFSVGGAEVRCARLNHPHFALGYRVEADGHSVAYVCDTAPFDRMVLGTDFIGERPSGDSALSALDALKLEAMRKGVIELCQDADLVIYDTMFEMNEYKAFPHWGHSTPTHAVEIAEAANAKQLALYHYHPQRSDAEQDRVLEATRRFATLPVISAKESMEVDLADGKARLVANQPEGTG